MWVSENPFLLPPGTPSPSPTNPPPADPVTVRPAEAPAASPARDPDHYIAVPPSVESVTHRFVRIETDSVAEPGGESIDEETHFAPISPASSGPPSWSLVLPDGSRLRLDGPMLLGRDPAPLADQPTATLVPLADSSKTVSKTHALFVPADGGVRVTDLHSTNGVAITSGTVRVVLVAGGDGIAPLGGLVELGAFTIGVAPIASEL
jgi:hypothetical protein